MPDWNHSEALQDTRIKYYYAYIVADERITITSPNTRHRNFSSSVEPPSCSHIAKYLPISSRHKVRSFGYKHTLKLTVTPHPCSILPSSSGSSSDVEKVQVSVTRRQFVYNPMSSKYVKAIEMQIGDFVLCYRKHIWKVIDVQEGGYEEVVELCSSERDMYSIGSCGMGVASFAPYRDNEAVESFGIIACRHKGESHTREREYLLVQRRDTMAYRDLIRGQYCNQPVEQICTVYFQEMTAYERERVLSWSFDRLWYSIWNNDMIEYFSSPVRLTKQYREAKEKYERLDMIHLISLAGPPVYSEPEYGLPKGRPMKNETSRQTALREFTEEVGISPLAIANDNILEFLPGPPLVEKFRATNGLRYIHTYFLASFKPAFDIEVTVDRTNEVQASEIGNVLFASLPSALQRFRPYDRAKKEILIEADLRFQKLLAY